MRSGSSRSINAGRRGTATVTRIRNGKATKPGQVGARLATGNAVSRRVGIRPGTPLGGNKNVRFLSPGHVKARGVFPVTGSGLVDARGIGRARSRHVASKATKAPNGYVVSYSPKKG